MSNPSANSDFTPNFPNANDPNHSNDAPPTNLEDTTTDLELSASELDGTVPDLENNRYIEEDIEQELGQEIEEEYNAAQSGGAVSISFPLPEQEDVDSCEGENQTARSIQRKHRVSRSMIRELGVTKALVITSLAGFQQRYGLQRPIFLRRWPYLSVSSVYSAVESLFEASLLLPFSRLSYGHRNRTRHFIVPPPVVARALERPHLWFGLNDAHNLGSVPKALILAHIELRQMENPDFSRKDFDQIHRRLHGPESADCSAVYHRTETGCSQRSSSRAFENATDRHYSGLRSQPAPPLRDFARRGCCGSTGRLFLRVSETADLFSARSHRSRPEALYKPKF